MLHPSLCLLPTSSRLLDTMRHCMQPPLHGVTNFPQRAMMSTRPSTSVHSSNSNLAPQQQYMVVQQIPSREHGNAALQQQLWRMQQMVVQQPRDDAKIQQPLQPLSPLDASLLTELEGKERRGHWNGIIKSQWRYSDDVLRHHMLTTRGLTACASVLPNLPREVLLAMLRTRFDAAMYTSFARQVHNHPTWAALATRVQLRALAPGYVYSFANKQRSRVKVGVTSEPIARKSWHRQCYGPFVEYDTLLPTPCMRITEELVHKHLALQPWCKAAEPLSCKRCNAHHGEWFRGAAARQRLKAVEVQPVMVFSVLILHNARRKW